ncbi:hypothetical protein CLV59_11355 [Chitinophaga dinghuensis]|uniref:Outer membrane protein with beta-barrel domain n=1 Tax=Chitinophaga dinghuensis TaxID=1539050 RepID=A0A327VHD6_9BACT|nr:hypothetical protein [Chitinophaga dinghuensis]RAJ73502.1 hypothetical protein CLV59_11355 [Chitinophaga dinghuensis]
MKKVLLLAVMGLMGSKLYAQDFKHGIGTGFIFSTPPGTVGSEGDVSLNYYPRVNFELNKSTSIAVGVPLAFGFGGSYSDGFGGTRKTFSFAINAPVMAEYNFGAGAVKNTSRRFGAFAGAGFGLHYGHYYYSDSYYEDLSVNSNKTSAGPAASLGVRFAVGRGKHNIEVRTSYMHTLGNDGGNIVGTYCLFNF